LAEDGLVQRGYGEEIFLQPLYRRAEQLTNPAKQMLLDLENGMTMESLILSYASLERTAERVNTIVS
jgi:hypothetical protein